MMGENDTIDGKFEPLRAWPMTPIVRSYTIGRSVRPSGSETKWEKSRRQADQLMLHTTFGVVDPKYHHNCSLAIP